MCFSVRKSKNAVAGNSACYVVNVSFYFILRYRSISFTFDFIYRRREQALINEASFSFQIQVSEVRYTSVTQTLVKIGKEEGLYGYFKVSNVFVFRKVLHSI